MVEIFPEAIAEFQPEGVFDHTPAVVSLKETTRKGKIPFRYYNLWSKIDGYFEKISESGNEPA